MSRSDGPEQAALPPGPAAPSRQRGIRRPVFWLALLWMAALAVLRLLDVPLHSPSAAESYLEKAGQTEGSLLGTLSEISVTGSGNYALTLSGAVFTPDAGAAEISVEAEDPDEETVAAEAETVASNSPGPLPAGEVLVYFPPAADLVPGPVLEIRGTLKLFAEADNPGEFDARAYYLSRGTACCMEGAALRIVSPRRAPLAEAAFRLKEYLRRGLQKLYPADEAALLSAVLLGDRGGVDTETERLYEQAGISHLLSVSGLHVSFWAVILGRLTGFFLSFFPFSRGRGFWSRRGFGLLRAVTAAGGIVFYMMLCGSRIPVQRAGLMAVLLQAAAGLGLSFDLPSAWGAAALAALIPSPTALFQASFQLSFGCVFLLGCLLPVLSRRLLAETGPARALLVPVLLQMGLLPLTLRHYYTFRPYAVFANLLAVPLAGPVLVFGFLSVLLADVCWPAGVGLAGGVRFLLDLIRRMCELVDALPLPSLVTGRPALWQILAYLGLALTGLAAVFHIRRREVESLTLQIRRAGESRFRKAFRDARSTALLLWLWLLAAGSVFLIRLPGPAQITSLYVGQGDCHVITLENGHSYLADGGGGTETVGERVILPCLKYRGIRQLEAVIVSHPDSDHVNGLLTLMQAPELQIKCLILPEVFLHSEKAEALMRAAEEAGIPVRPVRAGDAWQDGNFTFSVLYPGRTTEVDDNESSLVLRLERPGFSLLLPGDLGGTGEEMLLHAYGDALQPVTVLKAGHHGSRFSTSATFLDRLQPRLAVISCGRNNRFGHPAPETLERLAAAGCRVLRTDEAGAITLSVAGDGTFSISLFHQKEETDMSDRNADREPDKNSRTALIASIVMVAAGIIAVCLALLLPRKTQESSGENDLSAALSAAVSQTEERETDHTKGNASATETHRGTETGAGAGTPSSSWPITAPAGTEEDLSAEITLSPRIPERNAGRGGPPEDPQADGFYLDLNLTDRLYELFAGDLTNNTDPDDPFRSLSSDMKKELDALAEEFAAGTLSADELKESVKGKSFIWPGDKAGLLHPLGDFSARCYLYPGRDMSLAKERILLTNLTPRHYLFLRVYYHPGQNAVRIYMVNGLIY
nr:DNA internalization-related competence protein ComEC/Rec2 [Lachnospiraceae bacterium]